MKMLIICGLCLCVFSTLLFSENVELSSSKQNVIILLGPPGSGKGTQAVKLAREFKVPHISTGDLFRENISQNTELGRKAKTFMDAGKLVPDAIVLDMLFDRISRPDCIHGYLLDGFPRTLAQAEALNTHLQKGINQVVLNLDVPDEVIIKRAEGRLTCKNCGHVQNRYFSPPREEGICDQCGGELIQRADDQAAVVEERLKVYHLQTKPLVEYYEKKDLLYHIDGTQSPDEVFKNLMHHLNISRKK